MCLFVCMCMRLCVYLTEGLALLAALRTLQRPPTAESCHCRCPSPLIPRPIGNIKRSLAEPQRSLACALSLSLAHPRPRPLPHPHSLSLFVTQAAHLCNGCGITFFSSISLLAALFFSALSVLPAVWERETGSVAILSPPSTSTVATFTSPPPIVSVSVSVSVVADCC